MESCKYKILSWQYNLVWYFTHSKNLITTRDKLLDQISTDLRTSTMSYFSSSDGFISWDMVRGPIYEEIVAGESIIVREELG